MTVTRHLIALAAFCAALGAASGASADDSFPTRVKTAFGEVTIASKPERVVTWGWSAQDVVLDLGIVPVGMPFISYGGNAQGLLPWTAEKLEQMGAATPAILPETAEPPVEAIAALHPDVIIAPYSGLTEAQYQLLSQIAPVVAYPEAPWFASWQQVVEMTGAALGLSDKAQALESDTEAFLKAAASQYPALQGLVFANVVDSGDGNVSVRTTGDPRVLLFTGIGLVAAPDVPGIATYPGAYAYPLSYENLDQLRARLLIMFFDSPAAADAFFALPYIASAPQVKAGAYTRLAGEDITMAVSGAVTPLSLRWGFPRVIEAVGAAAAHALPPFD